MHHPKGPQRRPGRPHIPAEHFAFIRRISTDHPESGVVLAPDAIG
jgi:hypothetical protein